MTKPILVCMSGRGGARLERYLRLSARSRLHFARIILSIAYEDDSDDMRDAHTFQEQHPGAEVIRTGRGLPTTEHQALWVTYLEQAGAKSTAWIYWLTYDDEGRKTGIDHAVHADGNWLVEGLTAYFCPGAMLHKLPDLPWDGDPTSRIEGLANFPVLGPTNLTAMTCVR